MAESFAYGLWPVVTINAGIRLFLVLTALIMGLRATFFYNPYLAGVFVALAALHAWRAYRKPAPLGWIYPGNGRRKRLMRYTCGAAKTLSSFSATSNSCLVTPQYPRF